MKIIVITIGLLAMITVVSFYPSGMTNPERDIAHLLYDEAGAFDSLAGGPFMQAVSRQAGQQTLQRLFLEVRTAYKRWEWAAEYFDPALARQLNGPPVPEAEPQMAADAEPGSYDPGRYRVVEPEGLQVIEGILFPRYDTGRRQELLHRILQLRQAAGQYKLRFEQVGILPGQVFDAAKLEVFRLMALGITGFDDPLSLRSMEASAAALDGLRNAMGKYTGSAYILHSSVTSFDSVMHLLEMAAGDLRDHRDFDSFDRAAFITRHGNPLSTALTRLAVEWKIPVIRYRRLLRQDAATLFDPDAFDADAYLPEGAHPTTAALVTLGRRLFYEPALSASGKRSCASCHQPDVAFANGLTKDTSLDGHGLLTRNTPTLLNAALQRRLFYDLRSYTLEDQLQDVLHNSIEMQASLRTTAPRLLSDAGYQRLLTAALPDGKPGSSDTTWIIHSLAAYVRSLVRLNSRFDVYMRGDSTVLNARELKGFNLFMGKARCGTCHYLPLFNGNFPPAYSRMEAEVIGVPATTGSRSIDPDPGRWDIVRAPFLLHAFRTSTVRNTARTAPYMHNGVFSTLEQVVDFYDNGGGAGEKLDVVNQTLAADSLHLSATEKMALVAFIKSLDSR